eukprot:s296_g1.t1
MLRAEASCLDGAVPEQALKALADLTTGESYPIGIWVNDWAASHLAANVAQIMIQETQTQETLGYNTTLKGPGPLALDGFFALTGCTSPTNSADRGCGTSTTYVHINLEVWTTAYPADWDQLQAKHPDMAPTNLGNMGYYGATAMYVPSAVLGKGYEAEGIHLDFYRDYNASRENPGRYFSSPSDLDVSKLLPCSETALMLSEVMNNYWDITGDSAGVVGTAPEIIGKCWDTYFWLYWWVPDPTFLRLTPRRITFPEHNADEWAAGNRRSASRDVSIDKHVSQDLIHLAPEVEELVSKLSMSLNSMNELLLDQLNTGDPNFDVACRWLRANEASWSAWVPEKGKCFSQFGMYSDTRHEVLKAHINVFFSQTGQKLVPSERFTLNCYMEQTQQFLTKREGSAITCRACPSGFFSSRLEDGQGITFICQPCESGSFQASGASVACNPCPAGSYQNETAIGQYQDQEGSSNCTVCPPGASTRLLGSISMSDCGCKAGSINIGENGTFNCVPCGEGLDCPLASSLRDLKSGQSSEGPEFVPRIRRGYYSTMEGWGKGKMETAMNLWRYFTADPNLTAAEECQEPEPQ